MKALRLALLSTALYLPAAHADVPTIDAANLVAQAKSLLQEVKSYGLQLQQYTQEIQQVTWLATTAGSLIQHPNLGSVTSLMAIAGVQNPLPVNPYAVMGLMSGYGGMNSVAGLSGKLSGLSGLVNTSYSVDHLYDCTDQSFSCQQQRQNAASNAGLKGVVSKIYQDFTVHMPVVEGLRTQLATSTDPAQRENIIAQLNAEQVWATNAAAQLTVVKTLAEAQQNANSNRANEVVSQNVSSILAAAPQTGIIDPSAAQKQQIITQELAIHNNAANSNGGAFVNVDNLVPSNLNTTPSPLSNPLGGN